MPLLTALDWSGNADAIREWTEVVGWTAEGELTEKGRFLTGRALLLGVAASYTPLLRRADDLLFGDPREAFRSFDGAEGHVDRGLNVAASGFQHGKFFADLRAAVVEAFAEAGPPPRFVADMGCGDGSLLRGISDSLRADGREVTLVAADLNGAALSASRRTLEGRPHHAVVGDVADPVAFVAELRRLGIDPDEVFHVRSFLDHDRPPEPGPADETFGRLDLAGVYVDASGGLIPPSAVVRQLADHFARWARVVNRHGLLVLEVHCLSPEAIAGSVEATTAAHFDALQSLSRQQPVEADAFLLAAASAGLLPRPESARRYPLTTPFAQITLNWFRPRPFAVRPARFDDLPALERLEHLCWASRLRTPLAELRERLERDPAGCLVLTVAGTVRGVIYSQRIAAVDDLRSARAADVGRLARPSGPIVQLLAVNLDPEDRTAGFGDCLLHFMLQYCRLRLGVTGAAGVTRCRDAKGRPDLTHDAYARLRDADGRSPDPVLRFHQVHGARIVAVVPGYRPADADNAGHGVLIEYPFRESDDPAALAGEADALARILDACRRVSAPAGPFDPDVALREAGVDSLQLQELRLILARDLGPPTVLRHPVPPRHPEKPRALGDGIARGRPRPRGRADARRGRADRRRRHRLSLPRRGRPAGVRPAARRVGGGDPPRPAGALGRRSRVRALGLGRVLGRH